MRKRRRSRRNAWFGFPMLHRKASRRGWGRRRAKRRSRRNAGTLSIGSVKHSIGAGFNTHALKKAAVILGGNISTTWSAEKVMDFFPMLRGSRFLNIGTVLAMAGINGAVARKFRITSRYANDVFIGGILAGVNRVVKAFFPGTFATCGLSEDLDGLADFLPGPNSPFVGTTGLAWAPGPNTPRIGMNDYAMHYQVQPGQVVQLDGLANAEVEREIAMQM